MTNAAKKIETKSIGTLIAALNSKAAAKGCDAKAAHFTIDRTWGDKCGIAITGADRARAADFAVEYFRKHLAPLRSYDAQYSLGERTETQLATYTNGNVGYAKHARSDSSAVIEDAIVISMVYWPGAE